MQTLNQRKKQQIRTSKLKSFCKVPRFCKPRISALKQHFLSNPIKSFSASRLLSPPAATVFFPPYGGPMLLPQHFLPPAAAHKRTATKPVAVLSNALRAPSMHDSRSDSPIAISKSPCTYPLSRILPSNRVIPLPWSDRNSIPPHRPHAAAQ